MAVDGRSYLELLRETEMSTGMRECLAALRAWVRPAPCIHFHCDEHSVNRSCLLWALRGLELMGTWDRDPYHRAWNDLKQAIFTSGLGSVWTSALVMLNAVHGPWQSSTWFTDLVESLMQMCEEMSPEDRLLAEFWEGIVDDSVRSRVPGVEPLTNDTAGKREFISRLSSLRPLWRKGVKVSASRWFSFSQKMNEMDHCWCSMCMSMVCLMVKQGWVESWQELLDGRGDMPLKRKKEVAASTSTGSTTYHASTQQAASSSQGPAPSAEIDGQSIGKNDAVQQTRQKLQALRSRCRNTLDWCGRLMLDADLRSSVRMLHEGTRALHEAYVHETRVVRDVNTRQVHAVEQSCGSWIQTIQATLRVLENSNTLERCGIACEELSLQRLRGDPDEATYHAMAQHQRCLHFSRFVTSLARVRSVSLLQHTEVFPQCLLGLLANDERVVGERLLHCYEVATSMSAAADSPIPEIRQMSVESNLNMPWVRSCICLLASTGFSRVPTVLSQMVVNYARSVGQTRIIEEGNQKIRDVEIRKSAGKSMQCLTIWDAEAGSGVINEYGMESLPFMAAAGSPPTDEGWSRVFDVNKFHSFLAEADAETAARLRRTEEVQWQPRLKEITGPKYSSVHGTNPQGDAERMCDQAFIVHLQKTSQWHLAERHWMGGLLPTDELVTAPGGHSPPVYYILWRGKRGCLGWHMRVTGSLYEFDNSPAPLRWLHNLGFEHWSVIPSRYVSPFENQERAGVRALQRKECGDKQPLLDWYASHAYPELSEATLKRLHAWHGMSVPVGLAASELSEREQLKFNLMVRLVPSMSASEALSALQESNHREVPPDPFMMTLDADMLNDCILGSDHHMLQTDIAEVEAKASVRDATARRVRAKINTYAWGGGRLIDNQPRVKPLPAYGKGAEDMQQMKDHIRRHGPKGTQVCGDLSNQRFQIGYTAAHFIRKSVSWNKRGVESCLAFCIAWLWEQHTRHTGESVPYAFE
eukprot:6470721-Amphidinium_carterae.2